MTLRERLADANVEDILLADGFDDAFIGIGYRCGQKPVAIYSREKCISVLMKGEGEEGRGRMRRDDAEEYFDFNVVGAWVGEQTPMFMEKLL